MNGAMNGITEIGDNGEVDVTQETEHPFYYESANERSTRHAIHAIDSEKQLPKFPRMRTIMETQRKRRLPRRRTKKAQAVNSRMIELRCL